MKVEKSTDEKNSKFRNEMLRFNPPNFVRLTGLFLKST
jgi:hypothetical protein